MAKIKEETISSVVKELKQADEAKTRLQSNLTINRKFKSHAEKILWLAAELQRDTALFFHDETQKTRAT